MELNLKNMLIDQVIMVVLHPEISEDDFQKRSNEVLTKLSKGLYPDETE